jgi:hypothetical protein
MTRYLCLLLAFVIVAGSAVSCAQPTPNVPVILVPPPPSTNQPLQPSPTPGGSKPPTLYDTSPVTHNVVVNASNTIFTIGIPIGYQENTTVVAEKPVDFWFQYLPSNVVLEVNGKVAPRDPTTFETKIGYTKNVTQFSYQIVNTTGSIVDYALNMVPSTTGQSIPVTVTQTWTPY